MVEERPEFQIDSTTPWLIVVLEDHVVRSALSDDATTRRLSCGGMFPWEIIADAMAEVAFALSAGADGFMGTVLTTGMPLVPEELWVESAAGGLRTWHERDGRFYFKPYSLADIKAVVRVVTFDVRFELDRDGIIISRNPGGEAFAVGPLSDHDRDTVFNVLRRYGFDFTPNDRLHHYLQDEVLRY